MAFDTQRDQLTALGYALDDVSPAQFTTLEPHVAPQRALRFMQEGIAAPIQTLEATLDGVRRISGVQVLGLSTRAGIITGIDTAQGHVPADRVIVAAGTGSPALLDSVDVSLPMLTRPGLMMRTKPLPPILQHVLTAPAQELRQDAAGRIWAPTVANHQNNDASKVTTRPDVLADAALARIQTLIPNHRLVWDQVMLAQRPVPQDGLPVIGACGPEGLHVAVMHSGIRLAAITAELLAPQILDQPLSNAQSALVSPFGPGCFQSG